MVLLALDRHCRLDQLWVVTDTLQGFLVLLVTLPVARAAIGAVVLTAAVAVAADTGLVAEEVSTTPVTLVLLVAAVPRGSVPPLVLRPTP